MKPESKQHDKVVLLVEDVASVLRTEVKILKFLNCKVYSAKNGLEALDIFKNHQKEIDIVFSDMMMPIMGGEELFYKIKELKNNTKFVLFSASLFEDDIKYLFEDGLSYFIRKPFTVDQIKEVLSKLSS